MAIKIVSWNIRQGASSRFEKVIATLDQHRADIITLQEFRNNKAGKKIIEHLKSSGLKHIYIGGEVDAKTNTLLIASRYPFQAGDFMPDSDKPHLLEASIEIPGSETLTFLAAHFPQKKAQLPLFEALLDDSESLLKTPTLLIGDLNCGIPFEDSDSKTFYATRQFQDLLKNDWVDAWRSRHIDDKEFSWISVRTGNRFRYDQCLASASLNNKIRSVEYDHDVRIENYSDHSLLVAEIDL